MRRPLRVAVVARSVFPLHGVGGLERSVYDLTRYLRREGVQVTVITRTPSKPPPVDAIASGARLCFVPYRTFPLAGRRGTTVLEAARRLGVDLDSVCGGRGICGRCQVEVAEGEHAKHGIASSPAHLTPAGELEARYAAERGLAAGRRLGCTACVAGDLVVDVPPESQLYRQVVGRESVV